ncbi:MAG: hypothetical protein ABIT96_09240 [Ferruginibacter sp.]
MNDNRLLWRYAGLAMQFLVGIALTLFAGYKLDEVAGYSMPLAVWALPLLFIVFIIYKIIKDTQSKK